MCGAPFGRKDVLAKHKKSHEKENGKQKESKSSDPLPIVKKQRMTRKFVLIPKHKYEQLEKDAPPNNGSLLESPLSSQWSQLLPSYTTDNNDNQFDHYLMLRREQMIKLFVILMMMMVMIMMLLM